MIAAPLGLVFGLAIGRALAEALEWGKVATMATEAVIAGGSALLIGWLINYWFGHDVELKEKGKS